MSDTAIANVGGIAYRYAGPADAPAVLLVHGYPESSHMWHHALEALGEDGWRALAPDLPGYGDSELQPDQTGAWEEHVQVLDRFVRALAPGPVALVTHDWGVMIGLRWACDHPGAANALVISDGGFFSDRRWHDLANLMRTPEEGEQLIASYTQEGFYAALRSISRGMDEHALREYWKAFADERRRLAQLTLYRSGDFEKLVPYDGRLAALSLPALVLWGAQDRFAGPRMAERFHDELDGSELVVLEDAGHFVWDDQPALTCSALVDFLARRLR